MQGVCKINGRDGRALLLYCLSKLLPWLNANANKIDNALKAKLGQINQQIGHLQNQLENITDEVNQGNETTDGPDDDTSGLVSDARLVIDEERRADVQRQIDVLEAEVKELGTDVANLYSGANVEPTEGLKALMASWSAYSKMQGIILGFAMKDQDVKVEERAGLQTVVDDWATAHFKYSTLGQKGIYMFIYRHFYAGFIEWLHDEYPYLEIDMLSTESSEANNKRVKTLMRSLFGFMKGSAKWIKSKCNDSFDYLIVDFATRILYFVDTIPKGVAGKKRARAARQKAAEAGDGEAGGGAAAVV